MPGRVGVQQQQRDVEAAIRAVASARRSARVRASGSFHAASVIGAAVLVEPGDVGQAGPQLRAAVQVNRGPERRQALAERDEPAR